MDPRHYHLCDANIYGIEALNAPCSLNALVPADDDALAIELGDMIADPAPTAEEQMIIDAEVAVMEAGVRSFVLSLSPYMRCIVVRTFWFGQSPQEIANALGRKRPAIYNALSRLPSTGQKFFDRTAAA